MRRVLRQGARIAGSCCLLSAFAAAGGSQPGVIVGWGNNGVPQGLKHVVAVAGGTYHSMALQSDGTVVAWGYNGHGQTNVPPGVSNVVAIAAGDQDSLALQKNGTVVAWGYNNYGQTNVPPGLSNVVAIAGGGYHNLALQSNGTVVAWGLWVEGQITVPPGLSNVVAIAAGGYHSLALQSNGTVVAWGDYFWGQTNIPPGLSNVVAISAGLYHSLALQADGTVVAWGQISYGVTSVPPGLSNVVAIAAGGSYSLALQRDGTVVGWANAATNIPPGLNDVVDISAGMGDPLAITLAPFLLSEPPAALSLLPGVNTNLSVGVVSESPFACQWSLNGQIIPGATDVSLLISNFDITKAGVYVVGVTNQHGDFTAASSVVRLTNSPVILVDGIDAGGGTIARTNPPSITMKSSFGTNANIFYTLDGSPPSYLSTPYHGAFQLGSGSTIRARAYDSAYLSSAEAAPITVVLQVPAFYSLSATTPGGGSVSSSPAPYSGGNLFLSNTLVTITATPSNGWSFLGWLGDMSGPSPVIAFSIHHAMTVEAVFGTSLVSNVLGSGHIQFDPASPVYPFGSVVRVTAIPQTGSYFINWAGAFNGSNNPNAILMTASNPVVTALFGPLAGGQYALTVQPQGAGTVTVSPSQNLYSSGAAVVLTAVPKQGESFTGWSGDAVGSQNPLNLTMNQSKVITANFTQYPVLSTSPPLDGRVPEGFRFSLIGGLGASFRIDGSADLLSWTPLGRITNNFGTAQFLDAGAITNAVRFYRAVAQ